MDSGDVVLFSPWDNAWVPLYEKAFQDRGWKFQHRKSYQDAPKASVYLHGWAAANPVKGSKNVVFLRRYELYNAPWWNLDWSLVDHLVCVNTYIAETVKDQFEKNGVKTKVSVIYNAVDPKDWTWKERRPNKNVGMACHIHPRKNLPLALQVMAQLPEDYALHIAGAVQDQFTLDYLVNLADSLRRKVYLYGEIPFSQMNLWWEQMGVCLSTSLSEGCPNNVIQAMAKGIKPVVHIWPGATEQFPNEVLFGTADEAAQMIRDTTYDSQKYLQIVKESFGMSNIEKVVDLCVS